MGLLSFLFGKKKEVIPTQTPVQPIVQTAVKEATVQVAKTIVEEKVMKTGEQGIQLITHFEGFFDLAYKDPIGILTIGYGHIKGVYAGQRITKDQGIAFLREDLAEAEGHVNDAVKVPLTQNQFDALVAFVFNVGGGAFRKSTLLSLLNQGNYDAVPAQLARWNKAGGKELPGLTRRRRSEGVLFSQNVLDFN